MTEKNIKSKDKLLWLQLFFLLIGPQITISQIHLDTKNFTLICLSILCAFMFFKKVLVHRLVISIVLLLLFQIAYVFLITSVNGFLDTMGLKITILTILSFMSAYFIFFKYRTRYEKDAQRHFFQDISAIAAIDSLFVIAAYFNSTVWNFGYKYLGGSTLEINEFISQIEQSRRSFDIGIGSGAMASISFSIFFVICILNFMKYKSLYLSFLCLLILFATSLLGRTGLFIELVILLIVSPIIIKNMLSNFKIKISSVRGLLSMSVLVMVTLVLIPFILKSSQIEKFQNTTLPWVFEAYYNYIENGRVTTTTTDVVFGKMYFFPDDTSHMLFGNSNLGRLSNFERIASDVGYIRMIFGFGLIGMILLYLPYFFLLFFTLKRLKSISSKIILISVSILLVVNSKELHLLIGAYSIIIFVCFLFVLDKELKNQDKDKRNKLLIKNF